MRFCQVPLNLAEGFLKYTLCNMPYWLPRYSTMTQKAQDLTKCKKLCLCSYKYSILQTDTFWSKAFHWCCSLPHFLWKQVPFPKQEMAISKTNIKSVYINDPVFQQQNLNTGWQQRLCFQNISKTQGIARQLLAV